MKHDTPKAALPPLTELLASYHAEGPLGRIGMPFATSVFFDNDPPTPPAPAPAPTPPAPTPPAPTPPVPGPAPQPPAPPQPDPLQQLSEWAASIATAEKEQGKRAGTTEALKALGFDTPEQAQQFVTQARELIRSQETPEQRAERERQEAAQRDQANAERDRQLAESQHNLNLTTRLLLAPDVPAERREAILVQLRAATTPTSDAAAIDAALATLRTNPATAVLFTPVTPAPPAPPAPPGYVPGPAPRPHVPSLGDDVEKIKAGITARTGIK